MLYKAIYLEKSVLESAVKRPRICDKIPTSKIGA